MTSNQLHPKPDRYEKTVAITNPKSPMAQATNAGANSLNPSRRAAGVPTLAVKARNNIMP
jgi:hypothetical protein